MNRGRHAGAKGGSHIELTVSDCDRAALFWQDVMGFVLVHQFRGESFEGRNLIHASGVAVAVMTHERTAEAGAFDETRVGLDHLAFEVANREELERWVTHLEAHGVSNSGIIDIGFGPTLVFRDPDNMQLEFFVHPSADQLTGMLSNEDSEDARRLLDEAEQRRIKSQAEGS
jgi:glyoxylase I family protein